MPVSHLGLTVSHLPSAASFWLSALQPLGYRFIGHQGDSIGLGIKDADFFISQGPRSATIAPTHIAFAADDRAQVRECYASALKAGGSPSGAPGTRNSDCSCFNAAVEDLDGNTIEFILRESAQCDQAPAHADTASQHSRVLTWQEGVSKEAAESIHQDDSVSIVSKAKSRSQTALDLASTPAKSVAEAPAEAPASTGSNILSALSDNITPKAILGGAIGAVAAGAIAYAFYQSEQDSARDEAAYKSSIAASERGRRMSTHAPTRAPTMRRSLSAAPPRTARFRQNYAPTESFAPPPRTHRNFSVTESRVGPRPPPTQVPTQAPTALKAIEARAFDEDSEIQAAVSRHTSRRPTMARSQTFDPSIYAPISSAPRSRAPPKRSATMADEPMSTRSQLFLEGPKEIVPSSRSLRSNRDDDAATRHDHAPTVLSHRSSRLSRKDEGDRRSSASHASSAKTAIRDEDQRRSSASHVSTVRPAQAQIEDVGRRSSATSQVGSVKSSKRESSRYEGSRYEGSRHEGSVHGSRHEGSKHDGSTYGGSRHEGSRHEGSKHDSSSQAGSRNGATRDPDSLSDASTIKASRRDSAAHIPLPPSKAPSKATSRITAAEYRLPDSPVPSFYASPMEQSKAASRAPSQFSAMPDSPVPSYYAPPMEEPLSSSRAPSQTSAFKVPLPASKPPTHYSLPAPTESNFKPSSPVRRRTSHASGSAAGIPLPGSMASGVGYLDQDENDGLQDTKTVVPDDSISCIDISPPKPPRSDHSHHSRHSERSHRSHRTHQSSRSKHSHRPDEDKGREPGDAQTVLPEDSISSVGAKPARSEHSHRSHRSHRDRDHKSDHKSHHSTAAKSDHKSHHSTRSRHSKREEEAQEKEKDPEPIEPELPIEDTGIPLDAKTVLPEDSISSVGARPARSEHSHHSHRSHRDHNSDRRSHHSVAKSEHKSHHSAAKSDHKSHHSTRSRHSKREDDGAEREKEPEPVPEPEPVQEDSGIPLDAKTVLPEDSISSVGARPARSEHSHHSHRSHRSSKDDSRSHHSSRSKHSKSHDDDKEKRKTASESGKSDVTVKPAKSRFSALTLPGRLRGKDDEKERKSDKRSVATFA